jgi:hypothetical protein
LDGLSVFIIEFGVDSVKFIVIQVDVLVSTGFGLDRVSVLQHWRYASELIVEVCLCPVG